jgi:hypothetical protein
VSFLEKKGIKPLSPYLNSMGEGKLEKKGERL